MKALMPMEEELLFESEEERAVKARLYNMKFEELPLPARLINALRRRNLLTVGDVQAFIDNDGLLALWKLKNIGRKSIEEYNAVLGRHREELVKCYAYNVKSALDDLLAGTAQGTIDVVKDRFGFQTGKWSTLEAVANRKGCTRERIRQIVNKWFEKVIRLHRRTSLSSIVENLERTLLSYKGIVSIVDLSQDSFFRSGSKKELSFLSKIISEAYPDRYKLIDEYFLTNLDDEEIEILHRKIKDAALECGFPIKEDDFYSRMAKALGMISLGYLAHHLINQEHIEIIKGDVISLGRLTYCERIEFIMNRFNKPMHFEEISRLYKNQFNQAGVGEVSRLIHSKLTSDRRFINVGPGTYMLHAKFPAPSNIEHIVNACRHCLRALGSISDTKFLMLELGKMNIDTHNLNEYSLKHLLLEHDGFTGYLKFQIGLDEFSKKTERKDMFQIVFEVLDKAAAPLTVKQIWREIRRKYGYPEYAVGQKLYSSPEFIKIGIATYALKKHLKDYDRMTYEIERFAKNWMSTKKRPISTFLVTEVLRGAEILPGLPDGLAEHVLSLCPDFIKVRRGYFKLADNIGDKT